QVYAAVVQPDGKIVIGGEFTSVGGATVRGGARLNADGSRDTSFGATLNTAGVYAIVRQPAGQLLIGGRFRTVDGPGRKGVARLNADGSLDTAFNPGGGVTNTGADATVYSIALQPDGKLVIGGLFDHVGGIERRHMARLDTHGAIDGDFTADADSGDEFYV